MRGLLYSLVSRGKNTILASQSEFTGNFASITIDIMEKVKLDKPYSKCSIGHYRFYIYVQSGFIFLVMTGQEYQQKNAYAFLQNIQQQFFSKYPQQKRSRALAFSLKQFNKNLKQTMTLYMDNSSIARLTQLKQRLSQLETLDIEIIDKIDNDDENISVIPKQSQAMAQQQLDGFNTVRKEVQGQPWWKNWKIWVGVGVGAIVIVVVVVLCVLLIKK